MTTEQKPSNGNGRWRVAPGTILTAAIVAGGALVSYGASQESIRQYRETDRERTAALSGAVEAQGEKIDNLGNRLTAVETKLEMYLQRNAGVRP